MNVECQTIRVPTGVQDYRPALYGGIAAIELGVDGIHRVALDVDPARARTADRARLHRRAAELGHEQLGDHQAASRRRPPTSSTASSGSATRPPRMRAALERGDWDEVGRQIAIEWEQPEAAGAGRDDADDRASDRARDRPPGATAAKVCGAGGGGCLFCYGPPAARAAIADALAAGGARVLDYRIETEGLRLG